MKKDIIFLDNGWTSIQDADPDKHELEISCYAVDGIITEIRKRHHDGEYEKLTGKIDDKYSLPMPIKDFVKAIKGKKITFR